MRYLTLYGNNYVNPFAEFLNKREEDWNGSAFYPAWDTETTETQYLVRMDLPGVSKKDLNIEIQDSEVVVTGERKAKGNSFGKFERRFSVPSDVDSEKIVAKYEDGVLTLTLPKVEAAKPRLIEIQ